METIDIITNLMKNNNYSDAQLERELKLKPKIVYGWKNGRSKSYYEYIPKLCELFGVSADYLLDRPTPVPKLSPEHTALLALFDECDEEAKRYLVKYAEYQADMSRQRTNTVETGNNHK